MIQIVLVCFYLIGNSIAQNCQQIGCAPGYCCSKWGFCGNTPLHCQGNQTNNNQDAIGCTPPCRPGFCCSKWGYCGDTPLHCSNQLTTVKSMTTTSRLSVTTTSRLSVTTTSPRPVTSSPSVDEKTMTRQRFDCIFDQVSSNLRDKRWQGYQDALSLISFQPQNQNELMMFFAHVSHETDGLKTYEEYCGKSGACANDYQQSWCSPIQAQSGKKYYGRGWFQLSWPCNYNAAGRALGIDLLKNPEKVAESETFAAGTAIWFWKANNMGEPARNGNFGETTKKINKIECGNTSQQTNRIERYQKVRQCFGLNRATTNLRC